MKKWNFKLLGIIALFMLTTIIISVVFGGLHTWTILVLGAVLGLGGGKIYVALR